MLRKHSMTEYASDLRGNIAVLLAFTLPVILLSAGAAIDFLDISSRKTHLQNVTDLAVLAAASSGETEIEDLESIAQMSFEQNYRPKKDESSETFNLTLSTDGELSLETKINKPTAIMAMFGRPTVGVTSEAATILPSQTPLDIALVLDRTGSMAGANMAGLISASDDFIQQLRRENRDVRVSVIPFAEYVNIGTDNATAAWLDMPGAGGAGSDVSCSMEDASTSSCLSSSSSTNTTTSSGCTTTTTTTSSGGTTTTSTTTNCTSGSGWSDVSRTTSGGYCTISNDPQDNSGSLVEECVPDLATENWFGCVGSREAPYNAVSEYTSGRKIPPIFDRTCGQPILELTDNLTDVQNSVAGLTASGPTYIPSGLQWGWRSLTAEAPLRPRITDDRKRLLILMTDGQNTRSQSGINHTGTDFAQADSFTLELCSAIKSSDIEIATVAYSNGGASAADASLLASCASTSAHHFSAANPSALLDAFGSAADKVSDIRLIR